MRFPRLIVAVVCALALLCVPMTADASASKHAKRTAKAFSCTKTAKHKATAAQRRAATRRCTQRATRLALARDLAGKRRAIAKLAAKHAKDRPEGSAKPKSETPAAATASAPDSAPQSLVEDEIVACTNRERVAAGLKELRVDPALTRAAQGHAKDMNTRGYFAHDTPEGKTPWQRIREQLHGAEPFAAMGENLSMGYATAQAACDAWMASEGHRANILNADFTSIGTGFDGTYAVEDFGVR